MHFYRNITNLEANAPNIYKTLIESSRHSFQIAFQEKEVEKLLCEVAVPTAHLL